MPFFGGGNGGSTAGSAVAHARGAAVFEQTGQAAVHRRRRLAQEQGHFARINEGKAGQGVQNALS